jgi:hypothetical protein
LWPFAAIHVEWQSYDQTAGSLFRGQSRYDERILLNAPGSTQGRERRGDARVQVAYRDADPALSEIDAEDAAGRPDARLWDLRHHDADGLGEIPPALGEGEAGADGDGVGGPPVCDAVGVVAAGGDGVASPLGDALTVGLGLTVRSWKSIRKSKLGIVEAQPGETEISTLPNWARYVRASSTDLPCTAARSWPASTIGVCKPAAVTGTTTASPCVAAVPNCVVIDPPTRL